jgi:hypothetical protein
MGVRTLQGSVVDIITINAYGAMGEGHGGGTSLCFFMIPGAR